MPDEGSLEVGQGRLGLDSQTVDVAALVAHLVDRGQTVATAESLTGGLVAAELTRVAGSSATFRGGIVAYHSDLKTSLVGVDACLLARGGAVQAQVARQLADGVQGRLGATWGVATTGVAGPEPSDGRPVGTVFVAVAGPGTASVRQVSLRGDRDQIRQASVHAALRLLADCAGMPSGPQSIHQVP